MLLPKVKVILALDLPLLLGTHLITLRHKISNLLLWIFLIAPHWCLRNLLPRRIFLPVPDQLVLNLLLTFN